MYLKLFNHSIEIDLRACCSWWKFRIYKYDKYRHLVWGRLSLIYGQSHLEEIRVCGYCDGEVNEISVGDEGWSVCDDCGTTEGLSEYITIEEYERRQL